jgi:hypothetical protein
VLAKTPALIYSYHDVGAKKLNEMLIRIGRKNIMSFNMMDRWLCMRQLDGNIRA